MSNGIRYEKFKDEKIRALLKEKDSLVQEGKKLIEEHEKIEKELEKKNQKIQKIKDKVKPLIDVYVNNMEMNEWEVPTEVQVEGGDIQVQIVDQVEGYKENIRRQKEENDKSKSTREENNSESNSDTGKESN